MDIEMENAERWSRRLQHNIIGLYVAATEGSVDSLATLLATAPLVFSDSFPY